MFKGVGMLKKNGWISQYLTNHDTPRQVSRFANDKEYRYESATMLAALIHTWPGTPFIYQGEEIGMVNVDFPSIECYNEKYTVGKYYTMVEAGKDPKEALDSLKMMSRDNARTPMQWDGSNQAGFTTGKPWIGVNPRYAQINVAKDLSSEKSVYRFYQRLIQLRRQSNLLVFGDYVQVEYENPRIISHTRTLDGNVLTVIANYSGDRIPFPDPFRGQGCLLQNYESIEADALNPYEVRLYLTRQM